MAVNILGIISVVIFYLIILVVGVWAGKKRRRRSDSLGASHILESEDVMLAGRNIGVFVGIFTMTATWVGGGYINGTAEVIYSNGLIWCQAPFGYTFSLIIGGLFFATRMREQGYVTMLDPFQDVLGERMGGLMFLPALAGEIFWSAAILSALGATVSVIIGLDPVNSILMSAAIVVLYTLFGGLYAVAYTDVLQLVCIFIGLWLCIPFSLNNPAVQVEQISKINWLGSVPVHEWGAYSDSALLLILGGVPWQVYFQRVLSSKSAFSAQILSYVAALGCLLMAIPAILIGAVARITDWEKTDYTGHLPLDESQRSLVLPMVLQYLTPPFVQFIGLGAVSAAVMSSADSSLLSIASMFAHNIYQKLIRPNASEREVLWIMRVGILVAGACAAFLGITVRSVYGLWYLSSDLVFVILFSQLVCVVHARSYCNAYGSLSAYLVGFLLRAAGGEPILGLPPLIKYPWYDADAGQQLFPFRTFAMLSSLCTLLTVSAFTEYAFQSGLLPAKFDIMSRVRRVPEDIDGERDNTTTNFNKENFALLNLGDSRDYQAQNETILDNNNNTIKTN